LCPFLRFHREAVNRPWARLEIVRGFLNCRNGTSAPCHRRPGADLKQQNRHCERSEAIHSFFARNDGLLRRCAPRNDGTDVRPPSRGALRPRFASTLSLFENRGRREDRVRAAPAVSCAMCTKKCAHEHTGSAESIRPSLRNGFTAYGALSPATNSSCHRRQRIKGLVDTGWLEKPPPT
jgi:hypothetical protein